MSTSDKVKKAQEELKSAQEQANGMYDSQLKEQGAILHVIEAMRLLSESVDDLARSSRPD